MRLMRAACLVLLVSGCLGGSSKPSLTAVSDFEGVLYVKGERWKGCPRVTIRLPEPWGTSEAAVSSTGDFSATYAAPQVKPYAGVVKGACTASPQDSVATSIEVHDRRAAAQ
jgi:hypothetical protein